MPAPIVERFIGIVMVVTGITGFCGLYKLFGWNTCPAKKD